MSTQNVSEELIYLRKRARRRLVGAIALVVFALIVLWTALDGEPPANLAASRPVEIVSSSASLASAVISVPVTQTAIQAASRVDDVPALAASASVEIASSAVVASQPAYRPVASAASNALRGKLVNKQVAITQPMARAASKPVAKPASKTPVKPLPTRDPRQILDGKDETVTKSVAGKFYVQIAALADANKVTQIVGKLKGAGLPVFTEKVTVSSGELTRIRIGPAADKAHAAEWLKKAQAVGVNGQVVGK